jgi:hypothetical protein
VYTSSLGNINKNKLSIFNYITLVFKHLQNEIRGDEQMEVEKEPGESEFTITEEDDINIGEQIVVLEKRQK